tara:strand:- start:39 stop:254 length:216 start_codon:yes stop_codon:yes gene_type:complete
MIKMAEIISDGNDIVTIQQGEPIIIRDENFSIIIQTDEDLGGEVEIIIRTNSNDKIIFRKTILESGKSPRF